MVLTGDPPMRSIPTPRQAQKPFRQLPLPLPRLPFRFSISTPSVSNPIQPIHHHRTTSAPTTTRPRGIPGQDPSELRIREAAARKKAFDIESFRAGSYGDDEDTADEREMEELLAEMNFQCQDLVQEKEEEVGFMDVEAEDWDEGWLMLKAGLRKSLDVRPVVGREKEREVRKTKSFVGKVFGR
ncbi:MAG: hypothetical protein Q9181_000820 [Wetmoreana brouardii]